MPGIVIDIIYFVGCVITFGVVAWHIVDEIGDEPIIGTILLVMATILLVPTWPVWVPFVGVFLGIRRLQDSGPFVIRR